MTQKQQQTEAKAADTRSCTCHRDDRPIPCPRKFANSECWRAAVLEETQAEIVALKNRDRSPAEQAFFGYVMRVRRALEG